MPEEIELCPLAGYSTATLPNTELLLELEYFLTPADFAASSPSTLRLAMTRAQSSELSQALRRLSAAPHVTPPEKPS